MKKILTLAMVLGALASAGDALADDVGGSNPNGMEKVCFVGPNSATTTSEQMLAEALKNCRRGDILDIGWQRTPAAMQLCDFTKTIVYNPSTGSVVGCVYTGARRPVNK